MSGATKQLLASRCGFTTTDAVEKRTTLLLLRVRHLLNSPRKGRQGNKDNSPTPLLLAEECVVVGFTGSPSNPVWLPPQQAISLLQQATPVSDAPKALKQQEITELLERIDELKDDLERFAQERSHELSQSHKRVRATDGVTDVTDDLTVGFTDQASATSATKSAAKEAALLSLKIVDPACAKHDAEAQNKFIG